MTTAPAHTGPPLPRAASPRTRPTHDDASSPSSASTESGCATASPTGVRPRRPRTSARRHPPGDGGGVAERADPGARHRGGRGQDVDDGQRGADRDRARGRPERRPQRLAVARRAARARWRTSGRWRCREPSATPVRPPAARTARASRDVVEHGARRPTAHPPARASASASTTRNWPLADRHRRSRRTARRAAAAAWSTTTTPAAAGPAGRARPVATWRGHGLSRSSGPGPAQHRDRGGDGVRAPARRRRRRTPAPSPRAAAASWAQACGFPSIPAAGAVPVSTRTRGSPAAACAHDVGGAVGGAVVEHQDLDVGQSALSQQRPNRRARCGGPRRGPAPGATPPRSTGGGSPGGRRRSRWLTS